MSASSAHDVGDYIRVIVYNVPMPPMPASLSYYLNNTSDVPLIAAPLPGTSGSSIFRARQFSSQGRRQIYG